jgi:hypothetical protein
MCLGAELQGTPAALFSSALELCAAQQGHGVTVKIIDGTVTATYLGVTQEIVPALPDQYTECTQEALLVLRQTTYELYFARIRGLTGLRVMGNSGTVFDMFSRKQKASVGIDWGNFRSTDDVLEAASTAAFAAELVRMASEKGVTIGALATNKTVVATSQGEETTFSLDDILDCETSTLLSRICPGL